ncbi:Uncharacterized protein PECH_005986 [Penicillium ucsense]|uniref:Uncharacterized protein n=1 Tax=Penicillium ucsense TaxID=2839758 RepID=A0A8J8WHB5_9EURO|nr:Uncharacterized protein PECM_006477 [Penicillium ucsense]KAF7735950.1 Uncharacterized protein PECH_005986 [Penicillium ucsense]
MTSSALFVKISTEEAGSYAVNQVENTQVLDPKNKNWQAFDASVGPFSMSGHHHTGGFESEVSQDVFQMNMGTFYGNPYEGLKIDLNLSMVKGRVELRLNNLDRLWLDIDACVFQVAENGPGEFVAYRKTRLILTLPWIRCEPWVLT